jgi:uncharacterized protein
MPSSYLITQSNRRVDIPEPLPGQIHIEDVSVHLSRIPRFVGATNRFFSVAQHSLEVAYLCAAIVQNRNSNGAPTDDLTDLMREGLLHDGHEYLLSDIPSPVKRLLPDYKRLVEGPLDRRIRSVFGLAKMMPADVHLADSMALLLEDQHLRMGHISTCVGHEVALDWISRLSDPATTGNNWYQLAIKVLYSKWTPEEASRNFLAEYERLYGTAV